MGKKQTKVSKPEEKLEKQRKPDSENSKLEIVAIEEIEEELIATNPNLFKGISEPKKRELLKSIRQVTITEKHHSGPIPDAETITQYNLVIPNGADRIMSMAERQSSHRMEMEKNAISYQLKQSGRGQIFGFILAILFLGCGVYLTLTGHDTVGGILLGTTLVSLVALFVLGKLPGKKD